MSRLILASQSPRRKEILTKLGYDFVVQPSAFDERSVSEEMSPEEYVKTVALGKAGMIVPNDESDIILASDLTVWSENRLAHKPNNLEQARREIPQIWNRWHTECGACVVGKPSIGWRIRTDTSKLFVPELTPEQFEEYLTIADPTDKAGGIDVRCFAKVAGSDSIKIQGTWSTILGLDVFSATALLREFGVEPRVAPEQVEADFAHAIMNQ